jgi:Rod binding domain-containing protein
MIPLVTRTATPNVPIGNPQLIKLKKGARDFEAMMIQQLWKGVKEEESGANQALTDIATQAMSSGMAAHGGLGIAHMIEKFLK